MMKLNNSVRSVRWLKGYSLRVVFSDGYVGEVDLGGMFDREAGDLVDALRDPDQFRRVSVQNSAVTFANGYDICPDVMRFYCEKGHVVSQRETDVAFARLLRSAAPSRVAAVAESRAEYGAEAERKRTKRP